MNRREYEEKRQRKYCISNAVSYYNISWVMRISPLSRGVEVRENSRLGKHKVTATAINLRHLFCKFKFVSELSSAVPASTNRVI